MEQTFTTNVRTECPANHVGEGVSAADLWRIRVYVPDTDVRLPLNAAAKGTDYVMTDVNDAAFLGITADERGRLFLDDGDGIVRPITRAGRMVARHEVASDSSIAAGIIGAIGSLADNDFLGFGADEDVEPVEAICRSCATTVVIGPACVVCGDANPHAPLPHPAVPPLFDAPRLPEYV